MTDDRSDEQRIADILARRAAALAMPMNAEEVLAGKAQAGVPRPSFLKDHEDDGTVESAEPQRSD